MSVPIHLITIGSPERGLFDAIADVVAETFGAHVERRNGRFDLRPSYDPARDQYSSRHLLRALLALTPEPTHVLGVTDVDLFMPILTFVFGEAQLAGRAAVISTCRLSPRFYGMPDSIPLLYERSMKEALHELGHTYGLIHCPDYRCVMNASRIVEEIDLKEAEFCGACRVRLGLRWLHRG